VTIDYAPQLVKPYLLMVLGHDFSLKYRVYVA
jgi:hypothetical protein